MPTKKRDEDEDEVSTEEIMEEVIDGYKTARKIGAKLFGSVTLAQTRALHDLMSDDEDEFEDELRTCQEELIGLNAGAVTFDDVVGLYEDVFLGEE